MIYFDSASSTRPLKECLDAFYEASYTEFYNPNSIHAPATRLFTNVNRIKDNFLKKLKLDSTYEVIFTSGATESNNLAIKGYVYKNKNRGKRIITSKVEHESVLNVFKFLEKEGFDVVYLDVTKDGTYDIEEFKTAMNKDTILVSLMAVNNETGTVFNIKEIKDIISKFPKCVLHVDAAQTLGKEKFDFSLADMFTISAHKIYGIKGIGALIKKKKIMIEPLNHGGGQEYGERSGTLDYPAIVSFNCSLNYTMAHFNENYKKVMELQTFLLEELRKIDEVELNYYPNSSPYIVNFSLKTKKASVVVEALSNHEIYCSSVSACNSKKEEPSYVLLAFDKGEKAAHNSIRLSLSKDNTLEECKEFILVFKGILESIRG